jgi:hypothetical protein
MEFQNILPPMAKIHHKQNPSGSAIPLYVTIYIYIHLFYLFYLFCYLIQIKFTIFGSLPNPDKVTTKNKK